MRSFLLSEKNLIENEGILDNKSVDQLVMVSSLFTSSGSLQKANIVSLVINPRLYSLVNALSSKIIPSLAWVIIALGSW